MRERAPIDVFGEHGPVTSSTKLRRWDHALLLGGLVFLGVFTLTFLLLWTLPGHLGAPHFYWKGLWVNLAHGLTFGFAFERPFDEFWHVVVPKWSLLWRMGVIYIASLGSAAWVFRYALRPIPNVWHIDGPQLHFGKEAAVEAKHQAQEFKQVGEPWLSLHPDLPLPKKHWTRHALIVGSVGSGKTQVLLPIIKQLVEKPEAKLFLYDVKGDFSALFGRDAIILSPWNDRSWIWDIGADLIGPSDAAAFASSCFPAPEGNNKFWSAGAQAIVTGCIRALQNTHGTRWGWPALAGLLRQKPKDLMRVFEEHYRDAAQLLGTDPEAQTVQSLMATVASETRWISDLAMAWPFVQDVEKPNGEKGTRIRHRLSLREWASDEWAALNAERVAQGKRPRPSTIIVQAGPDKGLTGAYIAAMLNVMVPRIISPSFPDNEEGRTLAFVLDEFASLAKIEIQPLIDKGRSKGATVILGLQDFAQIAEVYGPNVQQALVSMVGTHIICQTNPGATRVTLAEMFGQRRVGVRTGSSEEFSVSEETRQVVFPTVLTEGLGKRMGKRKDWPHGFAIRALVSLGKDPMVLDFPGVVMKPSLKHPFVQAAWVEQRRAQPMGKEDVLIRTPSQDPPKPPKPKSTLELQKAFFEAASDMVASEQDPVSRPPKREGR